MIPDFKLSEKLKSEGNPAIIIRHIVKVWPQPQVACAIIEKYWEASGSTYMHQMYIQVKQHFLCTINYFCKVSNDNMDNSKDLFLANCENIMKGSPGLWCTNMARIQVQWHAMEMGRTQPLHIKMKYRIRYDKDVLPIEASGYDISWQHSIACLPKHL